MSFFIKTSRGVFGPFTKEQVRSNVKQGKIKSNHLISISKTGDFQKITKEFLSGEHGSLSSRGESPPELGSGNSFENPTSVQLSKPKKLRNSRKPKSRRELLEGSSIASTPVHAVSHFSSEGARYDSLSKTIQEGNESNKGQWLGLLMFVGLGVSICVMIYVGSSFSGSISQLLTKDTSNDPRWEEYESLKKRYDEINMDDVEIPLGSRKLNNATKIFIQSQRVSIIKRIDQRYPNGTYHGESVTKLRKLNEKLLDELYVTEEFLERL